MRTPIPSSTRSAAWIASGLLVLAFAGRGVAAQNHASHAAASTKPKAEITLETTPKTPVVGDNTFTVTVKDADGGPLVGAEVTVVLVMPMGAMGDMRHSYTLKASADSKKAAQGVYTGKGQIAMAGKWAATVTVKKGGTAFEDEKLTLMAE